LPQTATTSKKKNPDEELDPKEEKEKSDIF